MPVETLSGEKAALFTFMIVQACGCGEVEGGTRGKDRPGRENTMSR